MITKLKPGALFNAAQKAPKMGQHPRFAEGKMAMKGLKGKKNKKSIKHKFAVSAPVKNPLMQNRFNPRGFATSSQSANLKGLSEAKKFKKKAKKHKIMCKKHKRMHCSTCA